MLGIMVMDFEWLRERIAGDLEARVRFEWIVGSVESVGYKALAKHVLRE
jgi:hypothetical protein